MDNMGRRILDNMKIIYKKYNSAFYSSNGINNCTWDIIVLTTFDDIQKHCIELQLNEIFNKNQTFKERFSVIADPPGRKLGSGGSTLHVLNKLIEDKGSVIFSKKILIIHSGGYSQRLPSYTFQGKIFSPLPVKEFINGSRVSHMINLKLAMYMPFCKLLEPGIFVTCADDIETYSFDEDLVDKALLKSCDVVALAHPCDLKTATGHGVYLLPESYIDSKSSVIVSECREVLQKPSEILMREKKTIFKKDSNSEEMVYSDSVFWMSHHICKELLSWYNTNENNSLYLDAYAHFLPCLGTITQKSGVINSPTFMSELFSIFKEFDLKIIVLNDSKFYHLGTMEEYLDHFTIFDSFISELNLQRNTSNLTETFFQLNPNCSVIFSYFSSTNDSSPSIGLQNDSSPSLAFQINDKNNKVIIEWCQIEIPISFQGNAILSNCVVKCCDDIGDNSEVLLIPADFLFHTMPVKRNSLLYYVTVAFSINADMKATCDDLSAFYYASVSLKDVIKIMNIKHNGVFSSDDDFTLFSLKIFQAAKSPEESFRRTLKMLDRINHLNDTVCIQNNDCPYFSMKEIIAEKDIHTFLSDRKHLLKILGLSW